MILCPVARAGKTQYTKRLLPEFLIPHSVIRLDNLLEAAELPESERSETVVCEHAGDVLSYETAEDRRFRIDI